ncbi:MAG TPA: hypothetical protein VLG50_08195 [Candidatus Saccharimonadales bacterium]|nr:hypothetical protein [Candidatus Saccharimonadales bacterium]
MDINDYNSVKNWLYKNVNKTYDSRCINEYQLLYSLIQQHPMYHQWILKIPISFKIKMVKNIQLFVSFKSNCYRIVSWVACCSIKKYKKIDPLTSALRYAIRRQILIYKQHHLLKQCALCHNTYHIEVDHHPIKFCDIKTQFLNNVLSVPINFRYHAKCGIYMFLKTDQSFKLAWQRYHKKLAQYRYLCSDCNKKRLNL